MISFNDINSSEPYANFCILYQQALKKNQPNIEAIAISSFNTSIKEVESRFVNLKYINNDEWIFFSNYNSPKASQFRAHQQISALFYWSSTDTQVRIKANIFKTAQEFSDVHYLGRSINKNALAHSSNQSSYVDSYDSVVGAYNRALNNDDLLLKRPTYWGGFSFKPYYFEFWQGAEHRLNKRDIYQAENNVWKHYMLQP
jgi:pyridoxamine 5'-phosphate oxidase